MYVCTSLRLITKANFLLLHDDFDCMMNQVLLLQLHVAKLPRIFFFLFSLRLLLACFVKFFKAELCDKYFKSEQYHIHRYSIFPIAKIVSTKLT